MSEIQIRLKEIQSVSELHLIHFTQLSSDVTLLTPFIKYSSIKSMYVQLK